MCLKCCTIQSKILYNNIMRTSFIESMSLYLQNSNQCKIQIMHIIYQNDSKRKKTFIMQYLKFNIQILKR